MLARDETGGCASLCISPLPPRQAEPFECEHDRSSCDAPWGRSLTILLGAREGRVTFGRGPPRSAARSRDETCQRAEHGAHRDAPAASDARHGRPAARLPAAAAGRLRPRSPVRSRTTRARTSPQRSRVRSPAPAMSRTYGALGAGTESPRRSRSPRTESSRPRRPAALRPRAARCDGGRAAAVRRTRPKQRAQRPSARKD